jgi:hypothetical protein
MWLCCPIRATDDYGNNKPLRFSYAGALLFATVKSGGINEICRDEENIFHSTENVYLASLSLWSCFFQKK